MEGVEKNKDLHGKERPSIYLTLLFVSTHPGKITSYQ